MVETFTDSSGRAWAPHVNIPVLGEFLDATGIDLLKGGGIEALLELSGDIVNQVNLIYCACRREAEDRGINDYEFGGAMSGDCIKRGLDIVLAQVAEIHPLKAHREIYKRVLVLADESQAKLEAQVEGELSDDTLRETIEAELKKAVDAQ